MHEVVDWNNYSKKGLLRAVIDPRDVRGYKNMLIDRIHWDSLEDAIRGSKTLLDFGCGTGRFAQRISNLGIDYTGVDSSDGMIQAAGQYNPNLAQAFHRIDGNTLPFSDNAFDVCITSYVLQHFLKTESFRIFSEISRVVAPNGLLVSIEQATLCNKSSETVGQPATEADYIEKLSFFGDVISLNRIRNCSLTPASNVALRLAPLLPFQLLVGLLAHFEQMSIANIADEELAKSTYYDVLLIVRRNGA